MCFDVSTFVLTILAGLKFAAIQFPKWIRCNLKSSYCCRFILVGILLSIILNMSQILIRNFQREANKKTCCNVIESNYKVCVYVWIVLQILNFIAFFHGVYIYFERYG